MSTAKTKRQVRIPFLPVSHIKLPSYVTKTLFVLSLFYLAKFLIACCNCGPIYYYSINELIISNLDNSGKDPIESYSEIINKNAYGLKIRFTTLELTSGLKKRSFFIAPTLATSCDCDKWEYAEESVQHIKITTIYDFNDSYMAGSDITDLFRIFSGGYFLINEYLTRFSFSQTILNVDKEHTRSLLLITPPENTGPHQFEIEVTLSDGRILQAQTIPVILE